MQLYLMRHGEAGPATRDAERRLTDRGRDDVAQVLRASRPRLDTPEAVLCSPLARARQTAAIALRELGGHADLLVTPALMPESSPHVVVDLLDDRVGHHSPAGLKAGSADQGKQLFPRGLVGAEGAEHCGGLHH